jgi:plasmid stabilization system protein ParE
MPYKIVYKAYAERDIWEIADYLSDHSMPAAEKFLREVKSRIEALAEMPLMCPKITTNQEYRKMVVGRYVVAYIANEQTKEILIMRVVHGKRDYQSEL